MSRQAGIRFAGAGAVMFALLAAGCATPARTTAAPGTGVLTVHTHAAGVHSARPASTSAQPGPAGTQPAGSTAPAPTASATPAKSVTHAPSHSSSPSPAPSSSQTANPAHLRYRPVLGVYAKGMPRSWHPVSEFGAAVGRRPGYVLFYSGIGEPFPITFARQAHAHGAVPLDQIQPSVSMTKIADGGYDSYFKSYAREIKGYGHRVIVGFAHEMNGDWYSWGWTHVSPATWVRAWRRVVTDFRSQGAYNVTWLWTISRVKDKGPIKAFWPGRHYVTWIGIDGYYTEPQDWFSNVFVPVMRLLHTFTHKPILISESAIGQRAGQVKKIRNLLTGVLKYHLRGLVWFDVAQSGGLAKQDWRLEGHTTALALFRKYDRAFR